jgi:hypothetical protein
MAGTTRKTKPAKPAAVRQAAPGQQLQVQSGCKDLANWPPSWMGFPEDLPPGQRIVAYFQPFPEHLLQLNLSRKTIRKHVNNLWVLGGEIIRDLNHTPALRKLPVEQLVFDVLREGGPLLYHCDSEEELRFFESTCRKFQRFLEQQPR